MLSINTRSRVKKQTWISLVTGSQIESYLCPSQCYKSSKEQTPLLDVSLLGCSVVYKEKQLKRKEHKLKIIPVGGEAIVLALQSKEQTEQWLRVSIITQHVSFFCSFDADVNQPPVYSLGDSGDQSQTSRKL